MDLKTVRKNLAKGKYKKFEDLFRDVQLIWDNCKTYNIQGSDIYKMAETMEKFSKRQINMCKEDLGIPYGSGSNNKKVKDNKKDKKKEKKEGDKMIQWQMKSLKIVVPTILEIKVFHVPTMERMQRKFHLSKKFNLPKKCAD